MIILALFILIPIIEIALFIAMGDLIGFWPSMAIVVLTAIIGTIVFRSQGAAAMANLQKNLSNGQDPTRQIAHGALILVAGIVLCLPGYFTDMVGFLLLVPPVRDWAIKLGATKFAGNIHTAGFSTNTQRQYPHDPNTLDDVDYVAIDPTKKPGDTGWTQK